MVALAKVLYEVRELFIPTFLELVDDRRQHLDHHVLHTFHATVAGQVVGASGNFPNAGNLLDDVRTLEQI